MKKVEAISRPELTSVQNPLETKGEGRKLRIQRCRAAMAMLDMLPPKKRIELQEAHKPAVTEKAAYWGKPVSDEFFGHIDFAFRVVAEAREQLEALEASEETAEETTDEAYERLAMSGEVDDENIETMIASGDLVYVESEVTFDEEEEEEDERQFTVNVNGNAVTMAQATEADREEPETGHYCSCHLEVAELVEIINQSGGLPSLRHDLKQAGQGLTTLEIGQQLGFQLGLPECLITPDKNTGGLTVTAIGSLSVALHATMQMPLKDFKAVQKKLAGEKGGSMFGACLRWALRGDHTWASMPIEKFEDSIN